MIAVVGLSHLGLNTTIGLALKNHSVIGIDPSQKLIADLKEANPPIFEPNLKEGISEKLNHNLFFSSNINDIKKCSIVYLAIDVKTDQNSQSDHADLNNYIELIFEVISPESTFVIHSQLPPGFCRKLEARAKVKEINLFYQVETLIFGRALERATTPERYIVGASTEETILPADYQALLESYGCPLFVMNYESAELTKIAINMFLISTVSTTNLLAEFCEKIGANWDKIAPTLRLDKRIGPYAYLNPGLGISGGNLERDMATLSSLAETANVKKDLLNSFQGHSTYQKKWAFRTLFKAINETKVTPEIALWGLTYRPDTHSIKNSPAIELINDLKQLKLAAYDPAAKIENRADYPHIKFMTSASDALCGKNILIVMTEWKEFAQAVKENPELLSPLKLVIDPLGVLKGLIPTGVLYYTIGNKG